MAVGEQGGTSEVDLREQADQACADRVSATTAQRAEVLTRLEGREWARLAPPHQSVQILQREGRVPEAAALAVYADRTLDADAVLAEIAPVSKASDLIDPLELELARRAAPLDDEEANRLVLEAVIGTSDLQPVRFLYDGADTAPCTGRIISDFNRPVGTGFLISPRLVMTNHHVLPDELTAQRCQIQFGYAETRTANIAGTRSFRFRPDQLFATSPVGALDYTISAIEPQSDDGTPASQYGAIRIDPTRGKEQQGQRLNVVQHPGGRPKQVSLRRNFLLLSLDDVLHYMSDTERGSSGSPVYNDDWTLVALHHAADELDEAESDHYRRAMRAAGLAVNPDAPVVVNEGIRISSVAADVPAQIATLEASALWREALQQPTQPARLSVPPSNPGGVPVFEQSLPGNVNITINMTGPGTNSAAPAFPGRSDLDLELFRNQLTGQRAIIRALTALEEARADARPYLPDDDERAARIDAYYADAGDLAAAADPFAVLEEVQADHRPEIAARFPEAVGVLESLATEGVLRLETDAMYARSRAHLYLWVDLHEDRMLRCIYTGQVIPPEQLLLKDLLVGIDQKELLPPRLRHDRFLNCEHIVPQAWFDKEDVPQADLHHLITADGRANNYRSDYAYRDLAEADGELGPDSLPSFMDPAGRKNNDDDTFRPEKGRGLVARATLYFLVTHPRLIDAAKYPPDAIQTLIEWSDAEQPNRYERHRNEAIFDIQGNRNPFIDHPDWAGIVGAGFAQGLQ